MAKRLTPLQKRAAKAKSVAGRSKTEVEVISKPSKPIKSSKVTKGGKYPASIAKNIKKFVKEVLNIRAAQIRDEMKLDPHVLVIDKNQFKSLITDHKAEIKRAATRAKDPDIKRELELAGDINTDKLAKKLQLKFQPMLEKALSARKKVKWRADYRGDHTLYYVEPLKRKTNRSTGTDVFRSIQESLTKIRQELVQNSKTGSYDRVLSIVIAGFDVDFDDISQGFGGDRAKQVQLGNAPLSKEGKPLKGSGIQLGHFRGGATVATAKKLEAIRKYQSSIIGLTGLFFKARTDFHDVIHEHDAEFELNDVVYNIAKKELGGTADISIIGLEGTARNQYSGSLTRQVLNDFNTWLEDNAGVIVTMQGSKPIVNMILDDAVDSFLGFSPKTRNIKRKGKATKRSKSKTGSAGLGFSTKKNSSKLFSLLGAEGASTTDYQYIVDLLNQKLHDKIKENMGKGGSKQTLNYRTGRFARSAKIQTFYPINEKNAIGAQVRYRKDPYKVFEPGGSRLATPGRNPARIFGRSIRQLLQEEKIANLRRVKVTLRGE